MKSSGQSESLQRLEPGTKQD